MSTRSTTHFVEGGKTCAIVYRHADGYPDGHGAELQEFFADVEAQTQDTRYNDPSYLAAKLVVWLADKFANKYERDEATGEYGYVKSQPLDFLSVGVCIEDPEDIEYRYVIQCDEHVPPHARPLVKCIEVGWGDEADKEVSIPA